MNNIKRSEIINVLIIEDNEDDLFFIKKSLSVERYSLKWIMRGEEAFKYLQNPTIKPDIILLDNNLPEMGGFEIIEKIHSAKPEYSFIFLTADNNIETVTRAMKAGALDFIVKSRDLKNELPEKIEKVFEIHRTKIEKKRIEKELIKAKEKVEESERKLLLQNEEYDAINKELSISNEKLKFQNDEIEKRAKELIIANKVILDYKYALDVSSIVAITDQKGIIKHVNDNLCKISKYSREELIGQDHRIINSGYHSKEFIRDLWTTIADGKIWVGDLRNKAKDGSYYWIHNNLSSI